MKSQLTKRGLMLSGLAAPSIVHMAAYANDLTGLIPQLYQSLDVVSRELVGFIPSVSRNVSAEQAAVGQDIVVPMTQKQVAGNTTAAMAIPEPNDMDPDTVILKITKSRQVNFGWTGEEQRSIAGSVGYNTLQNDTFAQALRILTNEIEADLAVEAALRASRAYGTAGTTPFATGVGDTAQIRKILDDNGAPGTGRSLVMDTTAGAAYRTLNNNAKVNEAGQMMTLRDGTLDDRHGLMLKESAQVVNPASGTGASATTNAAGYAVGATAIILAAVGTGTILAGDVITFAGDPNKYVVATGVAAVSGGTITLAAPGLRQAIAAIATNVTVVARSTRNVAFSQNALQLVCRAPAFPAQGDAALDRMILVDPRSGIAFEVSLWAGMRKVRYEVAAAWGVRGIKPEHIALLLG